MLCTTQILLAKVIRHACHYSSLMRSTRTKRNINKITFHSRKTKWKERKENTCWVGL